MAFTRIEWEARFGDKPDTEFEDRPTFIIVRDPTTSIYWSQGEIRSQYFIGFGRAFGLSINGEYEPYGSAFPEWSDNWQDAQTYNTRWSAERTLKRIGHHGVAIVSPENLSQS